MARLQGSGLWLDQWLRHQRRDDYYKHGSICENYEPPAATCAMRPGQWIATDAWPGTEPSTLESSLRRDRLVESGPAPQLGSSAPGEADATTSQALRSPLTAVRSCTTRIR